MGVQLKELPFGLPDPGGSPPPAAQQLPSLTDLYVKLRSQGLDDQQAALTLAKANRQTADLRSGFREAAAITSGRPYDAVADRAQLMGEADKPIADLEQRQKAGQVAADEVGRTQGIMGADVSMQQAAALRDPAHPVNVAARAAMGRMGLPAPSGLTVAAMPPQLWATLQPLVEQQMKTQQIAVEAPGRAADVNLKKAETGAIPAKVALTQAEAEKAAADAAHTRMLTSGEVAPGYSRGGIPIDESEAKKINDEFKDYSGSKTAIGEILKITGDNNFILDSKKRAELQPRLATAIGQLKNSVGLRQLAGPELDFANQIIADPTKLTLSNLSGYAQNRKRFETLEKLLGEKWASTVKAKDLREMGAKSQPTTAATHYLISPDKKTRIPADAQGKPLGPAEPNPGAARQPNG